MELRAREFQNEPCVGVDRVEFGEQAAANVATEPRVESGGLQQVVRHCGCGRLAGSPRDSDAAAPIKPLGEQADFGRQGNASCLGPLDQWVVPWVWNGGIYDDEIGGCEVGGVVMAQDESGTIQAVGALLQILGRAKIGDRDVGTLIKEPAGTTAAATKGTESHQEYPLACEFRHVPMVRTIHAYMCDQSQQSPIPNPPLSRLAVVSAVLAMIPLCLPLNLIGSVLGVIAKRQIATSGGRLGGGKAAMLAIWGGLLMTLVGWWAWGAAGDWADQAMKQSVSETATNFLTDVAEGNTAASLRHWSADSTPPTTDQLDQFAKAFAALGDVQGVGIKSMQPIESDNPLQPRWSAWLVVTAGEKQWDGSAVVDIVAGGGMFELRATLIQIVVKGPDGEITLESEGTAASSSPPAEPSGL